MSLLPLTIAHDDDPYPVRLMERMFFRGALRLTIAQTASGAQWKTRICAADIDLNLPRIFGRKASLALSLRFQRDAN